MTSCLRKEKESYLPHLHIECEKADWSLISFESDTIFLFRKVQVQAGCGSSSFIISFNEIYSKYSIRVHQIVQLLGSLFPTVS